MSGRVQGVGYRFFADEAARVEGLSGWVRNLPDGRVEALVEGERESVERFARQMARGPRGARVDQVDTSDEIPDGRIRAFEIRR